MGIVAAKDHVFPASTEIKIHRKKEVFPWDARKFPLPATKKKLGNIWR
jgi:hypothetical protein